jgi:hypothetical protein
MGGGIKAMVETTQSENLGYTLSVYLWLYSPLLSLDCFFSFLIFYSRYDSLDGRSARRKAATCTQNSTNTV